MTITVMVKLDLKPEHIDRLHDVIDAVVGETLGFDGFENISFHRDMDDPSNFVVWEQWASRDAWDKYLAWRHSTSLFDDIAHILNGPPENTYFEEVQTKYATQITGMDRKQ